MEAWIKIKPVVASWGWAALVPGLIGCAAAPKPGVDAVSGATRPGQAVIGSVASDYDLLDHPEPRTAALDTGAVLTLVRWSNNLSYGLGNVAGPGTECVLLVPTVRPEATTDVRVLRAVAQLCGEVFHQPAITIGVPGGNPIPARYDELVQELSGHLDLRIVRLGHEPSRPLPSLIGLTRTTWELPESVALADAVILVPALWQDPAGAVHGALDAVAALGPEPVSSDSMRVDLVSAVGPLYVFADVLQPRVGPATRPLNIILASDDLCAVDAVGARLLGATPAAVPGLKLAAAQELGKIRWADINVNGAPIPRRSRKK